MIMDASAWFWLAVIAGIITIGVNDALCTYWKYNIYLKQEK